MYKLQLVNLFDIFLALMYFLIYKCKQYVFFFVTTFVFFFKLFAHYLLIFKNKVINYLLLFKFHFIIYVNTVRDLWKKSRIIYLDIFILYGLVNFKMVCLNHFGLFKPGLFKTSYYPKKTELTPLATISEKIIGVLSLPRSLLNLSSV